MANIVRSQGNSLPVISTESRESLATVSRAAVAAFSHATDAGDILAALDLAANVLTLRDLLELPEIKARVQSLQDTPIGFRTDKDPSIMNRRTGQPNKPYDYHIVKDAIVECLLRGLQLVGNQFNIIAGRFYCTKEGFEHLIRQLGKAGTIADFRPVIGIPKTSGGGCVIDCSATWSSDGKSYGLEVQIAVKTSESGSTDQYIGKATRKFLKRCYEMMTGSSVPEGDAGDSDGVSILSPAASNRAALPSQTAPEATTAAPAVSGPAMSDQQREALKTAIERQLTAVGQAAFLADHCTEHGCSRASDLPAESHSSLMRSLANTGNRERWNHGCNRNGEQVLTDELIASLTPSKPAAAAPAAPEDDSNDLQAELI